MAEQQDGYEQESAESATPEDWLAGARIGASSHPWAVGRVQIALNDMNLPDAPEGSAYA